MHSWLDALGRSPTKSNRAFEEVRRVGEEDRARKAEMKLLEQLRKLRRDRAELAIRNARARVVVAKELVEERRKTASERHQIYRSSQDVVTRALNVGRSSLEEVRGLIDGVDRARGSMFQAQTQVAVQISEVQAAEADLQKVGEAARVAATAHEKVLEWKRSV